MVSYTDVSNGRVKTPPPKGDALRPGRPVTGYDRLPLSPADRRRVEQDVRKLLDKAVKRAARRGRLPLSPRGWVLEQLLGNTAKTAYEGLATEVLWGLTEQDVKGTPGLWYYRLSLNDLGPAPGCFNYNDGQGTFAGLSDCGGAFSGLYKYLSRDLDQTPCSGPVKFYRTHKIDPCVAGEAAYEPKTEQRTSPLPPDPFIPQDEPVDPMEDWLGHPRVRVPRMWGVTAALTPAAAGLPSWYIILGQVVGRAGRGVRERKLRSVAGGLAAAWFLTTWLEVLPELRDVWEKHFSEENFTGHENVDKEELFFDLFGILAEEVFLDPILARAFSHGFAGSIPRLDDLQVWVQDRPGLPQIGG